MIVPSLQEILSRNDTGDELLVESWLRALEKELVSKESTRGRDFLGGENALTR
jgi:hypothetical protein